jgi:hypothetical protein
MDYAIAWIKWEQTGFKKDACPWKNPREFRNRKPRLESEARQFLAQKN